MFNLFKNTGNNKGQALVLAVIVIPLLLAFLFYALGIGDIIRTKIHLQNVADSAALSAATWQARGLNILVAMNNGIEACYISIAILLPALLMALSSGNAPISAFLFKAIERCWRTAQQISGIQGRFARLPWSGIAFGEAMHIININNSSGVAVPVPSFSNISGNKHAIGLYAHEATWEELMKPPKKKNNRDRKTLEGMKTIEVPDKHDTTVKRVNWHQKWKQRATFNLETGQYTLPWKEAKKVGKFYGPKPADLSKRSSYPQYPEKFKTFTYFPDEHDDDEVISWKAEKRLVTYLWPNSDPSKKYWYIKEPKIKDKPVINWPKEWEHLEEGFRWGYSEHESFWCYKWEPVFKDEVYSVIEEIRELASKFSSLIPENVPLPWVRDEDIKHDEACVVLTYKSRKEEFPWNHISNIFSIKPPTIYSVSQARIFRRTRRKHGKVRIKKVSNDIRDMLISLPPYEAGIEKVNLWGQLSDSDINGSDRNILLDYIKSKGNNISCLDH